LRLVVQNRIDELLNIVRINAIDDATSILLQRTQNFQEQTAIVRFIHRTYLDQRLCDSQDRVGHNVPLALEDPQDHLPS
jgi:hypothetical protein